MAVPYMVTVMPLKLDGRKVGVAPYERKKRHWGVDQQAL